MRRYPDWPERLAAFIETRRAEPFAWGSNDCGLFAADAVRAIYGIDLAHDLRGAYHSEEGAKQAVGGALEPYAERICAAFGFEEIRPLFAQRGDVVLWRTEQGPTLGIIGLNGPALFLTPTRLIEVPVRALDRAWRVP
jgi:hypothetical protein